VVLDETDVNRALARHDARAPHGESVQRAKPVNQGNHMTVLGALALEGLMASMTVEGRTDEPGFVTYVQTILVPPWHAGHVGFRDTRSSQQGSGVQEAIASVGARLASLPPDAPDFSPLETCWSKVTAIFRTKAARPREVLAHAMTEALVMMTPQDARGWFAHCGCL
jgi:transposase